MDGDGLAERAAQAEHRGGHHARAPERQDRDADHLPPGRAQGQRRLLVQPRRLQEHLAADSAVMIGRIMTASTIDGERRWCSTRDARSPAKSGIQPK